MLQTDHDNAGFAHAAQLVQVWRTRITYADGPVSKPKKAVELVYLLCSLDHPVAPVQKLAEWAR